MHLLIVDRVAADVDTMLKTLRDASFKVTPYAVQTLAQLQEQLEKRSPQAILWRADDPELPDLEAVRAEIDQRRSDAALIALADVSQERRPGEWLKRGADDVIDRRDADHLQAAMAKWSMAWTLKREAAEANHHSNEVEMRFRALLDSSSDAFAYIHEGAHIYANPAYQKLFGYDSEEELQGIPLMNLVVPQDQGKLKNLLRSATRGDEVEPIELNGVNQQGQVTPIRLSSLLTRFNDEPCLQIQIFSKRALQQSAPEGALSPEQQQALIAQYRQLDQQRKQLEQHAQELERQLKEQPKPAAALPINFTGLPDRQNFISQLRLFFEGVDKTERVGVLLYLLLTDYQITVDEKGFELADKLVYELAPLLQGMVSGYQGALLSHFADAVFAIFLPNPDIESAKELAEILAADIEQKAVRIGEVRTATGACIGLCPLQEYHESPYQLIAQARKACDTAQRQGRGQIAIYERSKDIGEEILESKEAVSSRIKEVISGERLRLSYQPIASFQGDTEARYKVYLQMLDNQHQVVELRRFAADAERYNLMIELDRWTVEACLKLLADVKSTSRKVPQLFVRLSANALMEKHVSDIISQLLQNYGVHPNRLVIELPEDVVSSRLDSAKVLRYRLKQLGCGFTVSHFGGKATSEQVLKSLTPDYVKLDIGLIERCVRGKDDNSRKMLLGLTESCRDMKAQVVASDITSAPQMASIYQFGISLVQGDMIQEPSSELDFSFDEFAV